jgi:hypothetical protein
MNLEPPPPDPQDPVNLDVEELRRRLLAAEKANAEMLRVARAMREGSYKSPLTIGVILVVFVCAAALGKIYGQRAHSARVEHIR